MGYNLLGGAQVCNPCKMQYTVRNCYDIVVFCFCNIIGITFTGKVCGPRVHVYTVL